jgi:hypothetical protein
MIIKEFNEKVPEPAPGEISAARTKIPRAAPFTVAGVNVVPHVY